MDIQRLSNEGENGEGEKKGGKKKEEKEFCPRIKLV